MLHQFIRTADAYSNWLPKTKIYKFLKAHHYNAFEELQKMNLIRKTYQAETKQLEGEDRILVVKISTSSPDRSRDVVMPTGMMIDNYLRNPVVAAFHRYDKPAIGKTLEIQKTDDGVVAKVQFTPKGVSKTADQLYELYKGGFMNAWSIGFMPKKWSDRPDGGREFQEWELLEYSAVLVPDNPEALTLLRSKGVNPEKWLKAQEKADKKEVAENEEKDYIFPKSEKDVPDEEAQNELNEVDKNVVNPEIVNIEVNNDEKTLILHFADETTMEFRGQEKALDYLNELQTVYQEAKEGRVLSEKNRKLISNCLDLLKNTREALQQLYEATEKDEKSSPTENQLVVIDLAEALKAIDKVAGVALRDLKRRVSGELGTVPEDSRVPIVIGEKGGE